jgi:hypothetical protein
MADPVEIKVTSSSANTVDLLGLDDINADVGLDDINVDLNLTLPQPFKTDAVNTVKADLGTDSHVKLDPLTTDSSISVDLKPAVVDLCLTLNIGKLPNVCIKQPYHHHIGFTLYGMEVWGYTFSGEQETVIQEQHPHPKVALGAGPAPWTAPRPGPRRAPEPPVRETGGLRIRLGG